MIPKIVRQRQTTGMIDTPIAGHHLYRPIENSFLTAECPMCGAELQDDEVEAANREESNGNFIFLLVGLGVIALIVVFANSL